MASYLDVLEAALLHAESNKAVDLLPPRNNVRIKLESSTNGTLSLRDSLTLFDKLIAMISGTSKRDTVAMTEHFDELESILRNFGFGDIKFAEFDICSLSIIVSYKSNNVDWNAFIDA